MSGTVSSTCGGGSAAVGPGEVQEQDGEALAHAQRGELQAAPVGGAGAVGGEGEQLEGDRGEAGEERAEGLVVDGHGPDRLQCGHGGGADAAGEGGGLAEDVAGPAQGEQRLVAVGCGDGHLGPAVQDQQDVRRGFVLVDQAVARCERQLTAERA